jgi:peptide/nickel transport system substrate-binding protein
MNTQTGPFSDVHLRKAIAYATDREGMVNAVFGGAAEINETLTPIALYTNVAPKSEVESEFGMLPTYEFNLEKAKEELAKSAYPHGLSVTFDASPEAVKIAQILAADAAKIGIKMTVNPMTESAYLEMFYGPREKIGLTMDWYSAFSPDPGTLMNWWLSPKQAIVNGLNSASYKNPQVGKLLGEQQEEADGSKRLGLITNIFQIMKEEVPYVPLFAPTQFMVISEKYVFNEYSAWTQEFVPWPMLIRSAS